MLNIFFLLFTIFSHIFLRIPVFTKDRIEMYITKSPKIKLIKLRASRNFIWQSVAALWTFGDVNYKVKVISRHKTTRRDWLYFSFIFGQPIAAADSDHNYSAWGKTSPTHHVSRWKLLTYVLRSLRQDCSAEIAKFLFGQ